MAHDISRYQTRYLFGVSKFFLGVGLLAARFALQGMSAKLIPPCWVRTGTHTVVFEDDPEYARFAADPSGSVRTFVRIWLMGWDAAPSYVGGVWRLGHRVQKSELRRVATNIVRRVGRARARPLVSRLLQQLAEPHSGR